MLSKIIAFGLISCIAIAAYFVVQDMTNKVEAYAHDTISSPMRQISNLTSH